MPVEVAYPCRPKLRCHDLLTAYGGDQFIRAISGLGPVEATRRLALVSAGLAQAPSNGSVSVGPAEKPLDHSLDELLAEATQRSIKRAETAAIPLSLDLTLAGHRAHTLGRFASP